jgi:dipeptidase E
MRMLLLSRGAGAVPDFLAQSTIGKPGPLRLGYLADASAAYSDAPFVRSERAVIDALGHAVRDLSARSMAPVDFSSALTEIDALYVAGGSTFALLDALRVNGARQTIIDAVRHGLPYIGASAGSIVAGPSIEPASLMDDPDDAPGLDDYEGLQLVSSVVIPHADGQLPPYPPELIQRTLERFGADYDLIALRDDEALLVDADGARIIASEV